MTQHPPEHIDKDGFRLRGLSPSRIDSFSDAVFAFALTLLVVSLEVPKTFDDLQVSLRGFLPFAIVFYMLVQVWVSHYKYTRRFGTHDTTTILLNSTLLFMVLYYVYPLKFLFRSITDRWMGATQHTFDNNYQARELLVLFGIGFAVIHLLIAGLYWNGLRQRKQLELTRLEIDLGNGYVTNYLGIGAIGLLACIIAWALPLRVCGNSGFTYLLIYPFRHWNDRRIQRRLERKRLLHHLTDSPR